MNREAVSETFSQETKRDLCTVFLKKKCCKTAFLYGALAFSACFTRGKIVFETEIPAFAELCGKLLQSVFGYRPKELMEMRIELDERAMLDRIFMSFGYRDGDSPEKINESVFRCCESDRSAFLRGVFLSCGTMTEPDVDYHLELMPASDGQSRELERFLCDCNLVPKVLRRRSRKHQTLYYKDSGAMEDFLNFIGAQRSAFRLMDVKIYKDLRNTANRLTNCDAANIDKAVAAAHGQMTAIYKIIESGRDKEIPEKLRETFDLRAAHPDATLQELADMHTVPISKSGVSHRLAKLIAFANGETIDTEKE